MASRLDADLALREVQTRAGQLRAKARDEMSAEARGLDDRVERADRAGALDGVDRVELAGDVALRGVRGIEQGALQRVSTLRRLAIA